MSGFRTYNAGELPGKPTTVAEQLANRANFTHEGQLYLVRCMACSDTPRGRENYAPSVATGACAWCGWRSA
jgi:hypothetical protein